MSSFKICQAVEIAVCTPGTMGEEGRSGKLSDQSEVLLHCSVANSNSESLMGTHSTVIPFPLLYSLYYILSLLVL